MTLLHTGYLIAVILTMLLASELNNNDGGGPDGHA